MCGPVMDVDVWHFFPTGAGSFSNGASSVIGRVERLTKTGDRAKLYGRDLSRSSFRSALHNVGRADGDSPHDGQAKPVR